MSSDSSDEDVHQCGRCKQVFHNVQDYFIHKKAKSCKKVKDPSLCIKSPLRNSNTQNGEISPEKKRTDLEYFENPNDISEVNGKGDLPFTIINSPTKTETTELRKDVASSDSEVIAPAKKRRAAREIIKDGDQVSDASFENQVIGSAVAESECKPKSSKRRQIVKNFKKAWAENYQDLQERTYLESNELSVPVKKRALSKSATATNDVLSNDEFEKRKDPEHVFVTPPRKNKRFQVPLKTYSTKPQSPQSFDTPFILISPTEDGLVIEPKTAEEVENSEEKISDPLLFQDLEDLPKTPERRTSSRRRAKSGTGELPSALVKRGFTTLTKRAKTYVCPVCEYKASYKDEYDRHLRIAHELSLYKCPMCQEEFSDAKAFSKHVSKENCSSESTDSGTLDKFTSKRLQYRNRKSYMEKYKKYMLRVHVPIDQDELNRPLENDKDADYHGTVTISFQCISCKEQLKTYTEVINHLKEHDDVFHSICHFCGKWFSSRYRLFRHIASSKHDHLSQAQVLESRQFLTKLAEGSQDIKITKNGKDTCALCSEVFSSSSNRFDKHVVDKHGPPVNIIRHHRCAQCDFEAQDVTTLMQHLKSTHEVKVAREHVCPVCKKRFSHSNECTKHRNNFHFPVQQVPLGIEKTSDNSESRDNEDLQLTNPAEGTQQLQCFVCQHTSFSKTAYRKHMLYHKVWVPDPDLGSMPSNLFEEVKNANVKGLVTKINVQVNDDSPQNNTGSTSFNNKSLDSNIGVSVLQKLADNIPKPPNQSSEVNSDGSFLNIEGLPDVVANSVKIEGQQVQRENDDMDIQNSDDEELSNSSNSPNKADDLKDKGDTDINISRLTCPYCLKQMRSIEEVYQHKINVHQLVARYRCVKNDCKEIFEHFEDYEAHNDIHSQLSFICKHCNFHAEDLSSLQVHKTYSHRNAVVGTAGLVCQVCNIHFASEEALSMHVQHMFHHQCAECLKVFKAKNELAMHMYYHTGEKPFLCDQCGAVFTSQINLNKHRHVHKPRRHECEHCGLKFNKREHLRRHVDAKHTTEKPFVCEHPGCGSAFKRKDKLKDHMKKHSKEKPYNCGVCGRGYAYKEGLRYHVEKAHKEGGKYACSVCNVTFNRPTMLQQHMASEHKVESSKTNLYPCDQCSMSFHRPERLNRHREREHKSQIEWAIKCHLCQKGFAGQKSLDTHIKTKHSYQKKKRLSKVDKFIEETRQNRRQVGEAEKENLKSYGKNYPISKNSSTQYTDLMQQAINETIHVDPNAYDNDPSLTIEYPPPNVNLEGGGFLPVAQSTVSDQPHTVQWTPQTVEMNQNMNMDQHIQIDNQTQIYTQTAKEVQIIDNSTINKKAGTSQQMSIIPSQNLSELVTISQQAAPAVDTSLLANLVLAELPNMTTKPQSEFQAVPQTSHYDSQPAPSTSSSHIIKPPKKQRKLVYGNDESLSQYLIPKSAAPAQNILVLQPGDLGQYSAEQTSFPQQTVNTHVNVSNYVSPVPPTTEQPILHDNLNSSTTEYEPPLHRNDLLGMRTAESTPQSKIEHFPGANSDYRHTNERQAERPLLMPDGPLPSEMRSAHLLIQLQNEAIAHQQQINEQARRKEEQEKNKSHQYKEQRVFVPTSDKPVMQQTYSNRPEHLNDHVYQAEPRKNAKDLLAELIVQNVVPGNATAMKFGFTSKHQQDANKYNESSEGANQNFPQKQAYSDKPTDSVMQTSGGTHEVNYHATRDARFARNDVESTLRNILNSNDDRIDNHVNAVGFREDEQYQVQYMQAQQTETNVRENQNDRTISEYDYRPSAPTPQTKTELNMRHFDEGAVHRSSTTNQSDMVDSSHKRYTHPLEMASSIQGHNQPPLTIISDTNLNSSNTHTYCSPIQENTNTNRVAERNDQTSLHVLPTSLPSSDNSALNSGVMNQPTIPIILGQTWPVSGDLLTPQSISQAGIIFPNQIGTLASSVTDSKSQVLNPVSIIDNNTQYIIMTAPAAQKPSIASTSRPQQLIAPAPEPKHEPAILAQQPVKQDPKDINSFLYQQLMGGLNDRNDNS